MLWEKEELKNIGRDKSKRCPIMKKLDLYEFFYIIILLSYFYIMNILTHFSPSRFVASITPGKRSSVIIGHKDLSRKRKMIHINGEGRSC